MVLDGFIIASLDERVDGIGIEAKRTEFRCVGLDQDITELTVVLSLDMDRESVEVVEKL